MKYIITYEEVAYSGDIRVKVKETLEDLINTFDPPGEQSTWETLVKDGIAINFHEDANIRDWAIRAEEGDYCVISIIEVNDKGECRSIV